LVILLRFFGDFGHGISLVSVGFSVDCRDRCLPTSKPLADPFPVHHSVSILPPDSRPFPRGR